MPANFATAHELKPFSFVARASNPKQVRQAEPGDKIVGVVGQFPGPLAAEVHVDHDRNVPLVLSPAAGRRVRRGEYLAAGADGYAVPVAPGTPANFCEDEIGARVVCGGAPGERITVDVTPLSPTDG